MQNKSNKRYDPVIEELIHRRSMEVIKANVLDVRDLKITLDEASLDIMKAVSGDLIRFVYKDDIKILDAELLQKIIRSVKYAGLTNHEYQVFSKIREMAKKLIHDKELFPSDDNSTERRKKEIEREVRFLELEIIEGYTNKKQIEIMGEEFKIKKSTYFYTKADAYAVLAERINSELTEEERNCLPSLRRNLYMQKTQNLTGQDKRPQTTGRF